MQTAALTPFSRRSHSRMQTSAIQTCGTAKGCTAGRVRNSDMGNPGMRTCKRLQCRTCSQFRHAQSRHADVQTAPLQKVFAIGTCAIQTCGRAEGCKICMLEVRMRSAYALLPRKNACWKCVCKAHMHHLLGNLHAGSTHAKRICTTS